MLARLGSVRAGHVRGGPPALLHLPHHQHANREGHPGQRGRPVRRGLSALASKREESAHVLAGHRYRNRRHAARCWWTSRARCTAGFTAPHEDMRMERPLWAEQRPENWWDAAQKAIRGVLAEAGVDGQPGARASGSPARCTAWCCSTKRDSVIRPSLIWCDQRSQPQVDCDQRSSWARTTSSAYTANPVLTGFTLPKLLWVRDNEPRQLRARAQGAAAQGLRPLRAHRRVRHRSLRRLRHLAVRRGAPALVAAR